MSQHSPSKSHSLQAYLAQSETDLPQDLTAPLLQAWAQASVPKFYQHSFLLSI
jgi:hypothetical protein